MADVPVTTIDATGVHLPEYPSLVDYFQAGFRSIYGSDIDFDNSTQDAQWIAFIAFACQQMNASTAAVYNAFSPSTAQGTGLSSVVKINGIARKIATFSTVDQRVVGQAGTIIRNGVVSDALGNRWNLPAEVVIPPEGEITVTATSTVVGAVAAPLNTIRTINTPTLGFQETSNTAVAVAGQPVESDAALRQRQILSTALPAQTILEAMVGALLAVNGVSRVRAYENDSVLPDGNGIPAHALALIVEGGDTSAVATIIASKKTPGVGTYGDITVSLDDRYGITHPIRFFRPKYVQVAVYITLRAFKGYTTDVDAQIRTAIANYINALGIGNPLRLTRLYAPANLTGTTAGLTFEIITLTAQRGGLNPAGAVDIPSAYNEVLNCSASEINITIVP